MRSLKLLGLLVVLYVPAQGMITKGAKFTKKFSKIKNTSLSYSQDKAPFNMPQGNHNLMHTSPQFMHSPKFQKFHSTPIQIAIKSSDVIQKQPKIAKYLSLVKEHKAPKIHYINCDGIKFYKNPVTQKIYFNKKDITLQECGVAGAAIGTQIGFWGTYVILKGSIKGACWALNTFIPGGGYVTEIILDRVSEPIIILAANKMGIAGGIIGATATGPA